jgi:hypothetical protein
VCVCGFLLLFLCLFVLHFSSFEIGCH